MKKPEPFSESFYHSLKKTYLTMRIATLLMILGILQAHAVDSYSQKTKLSLNFKDTELIKVLDNIESKSKFFFIYNEKLVDTERKVSITANNELIDSILNSLFATTDIKYSIMDHKIILAPESLTNKITETQPQQQSVTGTITDATTGEVLPGVNIQVKGTTLGAVSDISGKFSINIPSRDAVLIFSFVGYITQDIPVANQNVINIALNSQTRGLEEVVVIGYGTQKKETLTGSVFQVKEAQIQSTKSTSVASAIQGKLAGVLVRQQSGEPGTFNSLVSIRGFGTPLLVIDGVVRDGMSDFEKLNPMDIESISVLKDASAAIYGMNASNGVIIVTTKSGTKGKTVFSYSAMYSYKQPTTRNLQKNEDAYHLRLMNNEMLRNSKLPVATSDADLEKWRLGTEPGFTDYNWYKECLKDFATTQQHNFSAEGGNDNISFYTSFGYMNDVGILRVNDLETYKKYNLRTNLTLKPAKGLTAKISFAGRFDDGKQPPIAYYYLFKRIIVSDRGYGPYTLNNPQHPTNVPPMNSNAWAEMTESTAGYDRKIGFQYQTTVDINYQVPFIKGLTVGVLGGYDGQQNDNRFLDKAPLLYDYYTDAPNSTSLTTFRNTMILYTRKNVQSKISYKTRIGESHNINATLVNEIRKIDRNNLFGRVQYDDVYTHDIIDEGSLTNQSTTGNRTEEAYVSYLGRFNYDYKNKYLFEFSFREDGSYRYAPSRRWAFFPAMSAGWRIGSEDFIKNNLPIISDMKIRGSWGKSGQDAGSPFQYYEGYTFGSVSGGYVLNENSLTLGMVAPGLVNENLSWVNTTTTDFGIDLELWKGKFGLTWDYFQRNSNGLLATRSSSVPNTFGASFPQENLNSSQVKGFDLIVSHRNTIGGLTYSIDANLTVARQYRLYVEQSPYRSTWDQWKSGSDGNGRIQGRNWLYSENGQYSDITQYEENAPLYGGSNGNSYRLPGMAVLVDVNGDGVINTNDQLATGWEGVSSNPPLQYGSNINLSYKNFDFVLGLQGASFFTVQVARDDNWGYGTRFPVFWSKYLDRWKTEDPNANPFDPATKWIPGKWEALTAVTTGNMTSAASDRWRMDATYLRVKSLEVGYNVPSKITKKIRIDNLRAYVNCFNLYTFCKKDVRGLDPERNESDNNGTYTVDLTYPLMRTINFGVEIKF
jgi:TonB-linked SusC/RagA family outer membrane protein